jgi:hypothetical protein
MGAWDKESNAVFGVILERMDLSTLRKAGASTLKSKSTGNLSASTLGAPF